MTNLDSILKSRDITLPTKVCLVIEVTHTSKSQMNVTTLNFPLARFQNAHGHSNSNLAKRTYGGEDVKVDSVLNQLLLKPLKSSETQDHMPSHSGHGRTLCREGALNSSCISFKVELLRFTVCFFEKGAMGVLVGRIVMECTSTFLFKWS